MILLSNVIGHIAVNSVPKYGMQTLYGIEPTPEEASSWFILIRYLPFVVIILACSLTIGLFLVLKKKRNIKGGNKNNLRKR